MWDKAPPQVKKLNVISYLESETHNIILYACICVHYCVCGEQSGYIQVAPCVTFG